MTAYLFFNHHSLPFDSQEKAEEALPDFLTLCLRAQNVGHLERLAIFFNLPHK
jgi:hypothetical protein